MGRLDGKAAIITGSDSGIGRGTAIEFAREGADVVVNYHTDLDGANETAAKVEELGRRAIVVQADHSDEAQVTELFEQAFAAFGEITILVNNAGIPATDVYVADMDLDTFQRTLTVNVAGPFLCSKHFINHRKQHDGGGRIINVTSVHEELPTAGAAAYNCSKGALRNLTRTLALELGELGITVNNIAPGMILTPINQEAIDNAEYREKAERNIPLGRAADPQEIGYLAVFLASDEASYVTGSSYVMDGGLMQMVGQGA